MLLSPVIGRPVGYDNMQARQDPPTDTPTTPPPTDTTPTPTDTQPTPTVPTSNPTTPPTTPPSSSIGSVSQTISLPNGGGWTTIVTSIVVVTGPDGTITTIVQSPTNIPGGGSSSSNNTGVIVGASVGGAVAVALIALLWFILARKHRERRRKIYENDIFDPDHTVRGPGFDLGSGPDPETMPDPYTLPDQYANGGPPMQQYGYPPVAGYSAVPAHPMSPYGSGGHPYDAGSTNSGGPTTPGLAGVGVAGALGAAAVAGAGTPSGDSSVGSADRSSAPLTGRAAKEREAFPRAHQRQSMATSGGTTSPIPGALSPTHTGGGYSPVAAYNYGLPAPTASSQSQYSNDSGVPASPIRSNHSHGQPYRLGGLGVTNPDLMGRPPTPAGIVVHQDAGRVPDDDHEQHEHEIPPTYDSILDRQGVSAPALVSPASPVSDQPASLDEARFSSTAPGVRSVSPAASATSGRAAADAPRS